MSKTILKSFFLLLSLLFFLPFSNLTALGGQANIFVYHRFGDSRYPSTNVSLQDFEAHLKILRETGVKVLTLGEVVDRLRQGRPLPESSAVLTIDDGYRSFLTGALPLLQRYRFPATLFVSAGSVGREGFLSWDELKALSGQDVEIGNHSFSHQHLVEKLAGEGHSEWRLRIRDEIESAQSAFRENLGQAPRFFSYPYGEFSPELVAIVESLGFLGAVGQHSGVVDEASGLFSLPRFPMGGPYASTESFSTKLRMKPLPVKVLHPPSPILEAENPPLLKIKIDDREADTGRLSCFVDGREKGRVWALASAPDTFYVQAYRPLDSRRTKYTLTAPGKNGKGWYWFSQLWINTRIRE